MKKLNINDKVEVYEIRRKKLITTGIFEVCGFTERFIVVSNGFYKNTIQVDDLRSGVIILKNSDGCFIPFRPLRNKKSVRNLSPRWLPKGKEAGVHAISQN